VPFFSFSFSNYFILDSAILICTSCETANITKYRDRNEIEDVFMTDYIGGKVNKVIDSITFEIDIDFRGETNQDVYVDKETVRLASFNRSGLGKRGGRSSITELRKKIWNRNITLIVVGRDEDDRVIAYISPVSP